MRTDVETLLDGLTRLATRLADGSMGLADNPRFRTTPGLQMRLADAAAEFLTIVYAADAAAFEQGIRARTESLSLLHEARGQLSELSHLLRIINCEEIAADDLCELSRELLALLLATTVALRDAPSDRRLRRIA